MSVVFVTGVTRGIGRKIAELFIERGYDLYGCARMESSIDGARKIFACDVRSLEELKKCSQYLIGNEGKCDVLINNAGITQDKTLQKMTLDQWHEVIDTNLFGVHYSTSAFLPSLLMSDPRLHCEHFISRCSTWRVWANKLQCV